MDGLFEINALDFDFLAEAINERARRREEEDERKVNAIFAELGVSDRIRLNPSSDVFSDVNGVDGKFVSGRLEGASFDMKHHESTENTGLVDAQVVAFNSQIVGRPGWVFNPVEYVIWYCGRDRYAVFKMADLRELVVRELVRKGIDVRRISRDNQAYLRQIRNVGSNRMVPGEMTLMRRFDRENPALSTSQVNMFIRLSDIPGLVVVEPPSMDDRIRRGREESERRAEARRRDETEWDRKIAADEDRARSLLSEIKKLLSGEWNSFPNGYFRWSPSRKTIVYYKPKGHKIEEFRIGDVGSYNENFRELVSKLKEFVGTLSSVSLPSSMEQMRSTAETLGMPKDMDFDRYMRSLASRSGTSPQKWDWVKENGLLPEGGRVHRVRRMTVR